MNRQLSDEQLDNIMQRLLDDASPDDSVVNEIADSSALWWGVKRRINDGKPAVSSPWPPIAKLRGWITIAAPVTAAAALLIAFLVYRGADLPVEQAAATPTAAIETLTGQQAASIPVITAPETALTVQEPVSDVLHVGRPPVARAAVRPSKASVRRQAKADSRSIESRSAEIKTDFIALAYARSPESGQIVRVRVPSSMMVTLGLVTTVEKPSALIDAEVLVGDDGLNHAIRFIR